MCNSGFRPKVCVRNGEIEEVLGELWEIAKSSEKGQFQRRVAQRVIEEKNNVLAYFEQKFQRDPEVLRAIENVRAGAHKR